MQVQHHQQTVFFRPGEGAVKHVQAADHKRMADIAIGAVVRVIGAE